MARRYHSKKIRDIGKYRRLGHVLIGESNLAIVPAIGGYGVEDIYLGEFSPHLNRDDSSLTPPPTGLLPVELLVVLVVVASRFTLPVRLPLELWNLSSTTALAGRPVGTRWKSTTPCEVYIHRAVFLACSWL